MIDPTSNNKDENLFSKQVAAKEKRKLRALHDKNKSVWFGLGMMGMVGWSVAVPSLLGAGIGLWLDKTYPQSFSWALSCLVLGMFSGILIAWYWVDKEDKEMHKNDSDE
jgi:ATP synthase protein I